MAMTSPVVTATGDILASHHNTLREDIIRNAGIYAVTAGTGSVYTLSIDSAYTSYVAGDKITCKIHEINTLGATMNVNSIGALNIVGMDGNAILPGILFKDNIAEFVFNGSSLVLVSPDYNPSMLSYAGGIPTFTDNVSIYSEVFSGATIRLMRAGLIKYISGTSQSITASTIWASASSVSSSIIVGGYVYVYLIQTATAARIYRCSIESDISNVSNWTQITISGATLGFSGNDGLVGHDGTNYYCIDATNGFIQFTLASTTFTFVSNITVTGANYSSVFARVNYTGIYAYFTSAPFIRFASHAGTLDTNRQLSGGATAVFSTKNALYVSGAITYLLQRVYL